MLTNRDPRRERWQTLLISPGDLLELLRMVGDGISARVPDLPPDAVVRDGGFDAVRGCFVVVLESAFFEEATVTIHDGTVVGDWEEVLLRLGDRPVEPLSPCPEPALPVPWESWHVAPALVPALLKRLAEGDPCPEAAPPPDARVVDAYYDPDREAFAMVVESALFTFARPLRVGQVRHLTLPQRTVELPE